MQLGEVSEWGDIYSMLHKINLNYEDIVKKEPVIIDFLTKNSDCFSVTVIIKKPYSQIPPIFNYDAQIHPYATKYIFEKKDWLVDFLGQLKHQIMVVCRCCKESRKMLLQMPNIFLPIKNNMPEDICYFRNGKLWFATISHEKMAFILNPTNEDIQFLRENKINFHSEIV